MLFYIDFGAGPVEYGVALRGEAEDLRLDNVELAFDGTATSCITDPTGRAFVTKWPLEHPELDPDDAETLEDALVGADEVEIGGDLIGETLVGSAHNAHTVPDGPDHYSVIWDFEEA